jgi:YVTN family beta-propeller protein
MNLVLLAATLLVANQGGGSISFVDPVSMKVESTIEAGLGPHEAVASPDGNQAAVTLYGRQAANKELLIVDVKSRSIVKRIDLGPSERPHGVAWRKKGIYVTLEKEGAVARIDPVSGKIDWRALTIGEVSHMLAVMPDESKIYTGNVKSNDVSVINAGAEVAHKVIKVGSGPEGIALSPDGSELWAAHRMGGGVSIIDTARDMVVTQVAPTVFSARVTFTPDGKKVLLYDLSSKSVVIYDRASRTEIGRATLAEGVPVGGIAPDNRRAFVLRYQPDAVLELDLNTYKFGRAVETKEMPDGMALLDVGSPVMKRATGTFEVKMTPAAPAPAEEPSVGRMLLDKTFAGDLAATSKGQMLAHMTAVKDSAGYVAMERVVGSLGGRKGSFVLQHNGLMNRGEPSLTVTVVPDSGTEELAGLAGTMQILVEGGKHSYAFDYSLP